MMILERDQLLLNLDLHSRRDTEYRNDAATLKIESLSDFEYLSRMYLT